MLCKWHKICTVICSTLYFAVIFIKEFVIANCEFTSCFYNRKSVKFLNGQRLILPPTAARINI
jgi:hypothetical protein